MGEHETHLQNDWLHSRWMTVMLWVVPWIIIIWTAHTTALLQMIGWAFGFTVMGLACWINARQCGRRHCFFTGPVFLLAALASLLYGFQILPLGHDGWGWIAGVAAGVCLMACCGFEAWFGKYFPPHASNS
ncbi:MAG: hypothetical protein ACYCS1_00165 [Gammaproteobacteria bacterium]